MKTPFLNLEQILSGKFVEIDRHNLHVAMKNEILSYLFLYPAVIVCGQAPVRLQSHLRRTSAWPIL